MIATSKAPNEVELAVVYPDFRTYSTGTSSTLTPHVTIDSLVALTIARSRLEVVYGTVLSNLLCVTMVDSSTPGSGRGYKAREYVNTVRKIGL